MLRTFFARLALSVFGLLLVEVALQGVIRLDPRMALALSPGLKRTLPDDLLRRRPNPAIPDHDAAGWRNPEVLTHPTIVALGDSQTYGDEVSHDNAWPLLLGEELGVESYNMGFSGFGPVEYYLLGPESMEKCPDVLLVGIYSGNDMRDAYEEAIVLSRASELVVGQSFTRDELLAIDLERGPLSSEWRAGRQARRGLWKTVRDGFLEPLAQRCMLWGVVRGLGRIGHAVRLDARGDKVRGNFDEYVEEVAALSREDYFPVHGPNASTVLTPRGRGVVLCLEDPRIAAGARISLRAIAGLRDRCGTACTVVAVLIPTKDLVFEAEVAASGVQPPDSYKALLRDERELWRFLRAGLEAEGIAYVDVLENLRASVAACRNPYLSDWDGHPNVVGNHVIAERVAQHRVLRALRVD